ncbi:MAG: hypothetical protein R2873_17335 [Caldilineaceae bacterium]
MKRVLTEDEIPADVKEKTARWQEKKNFDPAAHAADLHVIFREVLQTPDAEWDTARSLRAILSRHPKDGKGFFAKSDLVAGYRHLVEEGDLDADPVIMERIRMKPMRTASGVAPVTVLTAPAGCPGKCIFCPDDWRMPKSYIYDEPGCQAPSATASIPTCKPTAASTPSRTSATTPKRWNCSSSAARGAPTARTTASGSSAAASTP